MKNLVSAISAMFAVTPAAECAADRIELRERVGTLRAAQPFGHAVQPAEQRRVD